MLSFALVVLSALVLALSGTVVVLGRRLYAVKRLPGAAYPLLSQGGDTEEGALLRRKRERTEQLCKELRRSLTAIQTAIPSAALGLSIERIRLLCADELKDKTAAAACAFTNGTGCLSGGELAGQERRLLNEYISRLSSMAEEVKAAERGLVPVLKAWSGGSTAIFDAHAERLAAVSHQFDQLHTVLQAFLQSACRKREADGSEGGFQLRIRQAAASVSDPRVRAAVAALETLAHQHYDALDRQTKFRLETYYLQTMELVLEELARAEGAGEDTEAKARLSLRALSVLSQVLSTGGQVRSELGERSLEAEVVALERLAAMYGDQP